MCLAQRQVNAKGRPSPKRAADFDGARVELHQFVDQREADAGTLVPCDRGCLRRDGISRTGADLVLRHADAGVDHIEDRLFAFTAEVYCDAALEA